jgi:hypothetical protein
MTAEPKSPDVEPAGGGMGEPNRPKPPLIDARALSASGLLSNDIAKQAAAGFAGGLVGAVLISVLFTGPAKDEDARQAIRVLDQRTTDLNESLKGKAAAASAASADQLNEVRSKLENTAAASADQLNAVRSKLETAASAEQLNEVRSKLEDVEKSAKSVEVSAQTLNQRVQAVEEKPAPSPKEAIQSEIATQVGPITERLAGLEKSQSERASDARTSAVTLALTELKRAVADGRPFATELSAVESLSPEKLPVSELAPYKDKGVPSLVQLQREFSDTARSVIQKHYAGKSESVMGEIMSRARAVVQVKPIGATGDSVESVLGRIDGSLKAADLKGALTEAASLEGPAKEQLQAWLDRAKARAEADEAVRKTDRELIASLTKTSARQ